MSSSLEKFERQPLGTSRIAPSYSGVSRAPDPVQSAVADVAATLAADEPATVSLGKIAECLGFRLDEAFIVEKLGIPWRKKDKSARLWSVGDYELIRLALIKRLHSSESTFIPF